jgi:hypothetical protein
MRPLTQTLVDPKNEIGNLIYRLLDEDNWANNSPSWEVRQKIARIHVDLSSGFRTDGQEAYDEVECLFRKYQAGKAEIIRRFKEEEFERRRFLREQRLSAPDSQANPIVPENSQNAIPQAIDNPRLTESAKTENTVQQDSASVLASIPLQKRCAVCLVDFSPANNKQKYCSDRCLDEGRRKFKEEARIRMVEHKAWLKAEKELEKQEAIAHAQVLLKDEGLLKDEALAKGRKRKFGSDAERKAANKRIKRENNNVVVPVLPDGVRRTHGNGHGQKRRDVSTARKVLIHRQDGKCFFCGRHFGDYVKKGDRGQPQELIAHVEHFIPKGELGSRKDDNLHAACQLCNMFKGRFVGFQSIEVCREWLTLCWSKNDYIDLGKPTEWGFTNGTHRFLTA